MPLQLNGPQIAALLATIEEVHSQYTDDVCWMDFDRIFIAAGLPIPDRRIGDKGAMLWNCSRFIDRMCKGGDWPSYTELEGCLPTRVIRPPTISPER